MRTVAEYLLKDVKRIAEPSTTAHAPHATFEPSLTVSIVDLLLLVIAEDLIPARARTYAHARLDSKTSQHSVRLMKRLANVNAVQHIGLALDRRLWSRAPILPIGRACRKGKCVPRKGSSGCS